MVSIRQTSPSEDAGSTVCNIEVLLIRHVVLLLGRGGNGNERAALFAGGGPLAVLCCRLRLRLIVLAEIVAPVDSGGFTQDPGSDPPIDRANRHAEVFRFFTLRLEARSAGVRTFAHGCAPSCNELTRRTMAGHGQPTEPLNQEKMGGFRVLLAALPG